MANPNALSATSITVDTLVDAQLASGDNNFAVPTGKAWTVKSITLCNVSGASVTLNLSVIRSGGTARKVAHNEALDPGNTLVLDSAFLAYLPEAATLRINSSAATAVDVVITGVVTA